jgi:hypothetical protein
MQNAETASGVPRGAGGRRQPASNRTHVAVTGEPVAGKSGTAGSGRGPLEKDPTGHLASGLPVLRRRWQGTDFVPLAESQAG